MAMASRACSMVAASTALSISGCGMESSVMAAKDSLIYRQFGDIHNPRGLMKSAIPPIYLLEGLPWKHDDLDQAVPGTATGRRRAGPASPAGSARGSPAAARRHRHPYHAWARCGLPTLRA